MVQVVLEVDVASNAHTDEAPRTRGIHQWLLLVRGTDERGVTAIQLDGLAIRRTELHVGRRQQILQHNLLRRAGLVELIDVDQRKRGERDVQVELILEVDLVIIVVAQFGRQQDLAEARLATPLAANQQRR